MKEKSFPMMKFIISFAGFIMGATAIFFLKVINQSESDTPKALVTVLGLAIIAIISSSIILILRLSTKLEKTKNQLKDLNTKHELETNQLWEVQERYHALMENSILGVAIIGTDFRILEVNKKLRDLFKKKTGDFVGQYCHLEFEKREEICTHCPGRKAIATGKTVEVLTQGLLDNGNRFYAWNRAFPIHDRNGNVKGFVEIIEDVTKQKVAENELKKAYEDLQLLQDQLIQSEKMASIGQLAAGIAHEINNPNAFITSNLSIMANYVQKIKSLLLKYTKLFEILLNNKSENINNLYDDIAKETKNISLDFILEDIQDAIKESLEGTNRISKIVQSLRTFSNIDEKDFNQADINEGIESALTIASSELRDGVEIKTELSSVPHIKCFAQQINQVILNLILNAIHAIEDKGIITIRSYSDEKNIYIEIRDTGKGIPPEHLKKIFDPFFTTEDIGKGIGLGLSASYSIIQKHNGEILAESKPGEGTCFTIVLPLTVEDN